MSTHDWERSRRRQKSGWMSPIEIDEANGRGWSVCRAFGSSGEPERLLSVSMLGYLELLDWTGGRSFTATRWGESPNITPILTRIGLDASGWCDVVRKFGRIFKRAAGTPESLAGEAVRRGQSWLCAPGESSRAFIALKLSA